MGPILPMASVVRFGQPWWLLALAAALVPPALAALAARRGRKASGIRVALQSAAVALLAFALAQVELPLGGRAEQPYLLLRDISASTRGQEPRLTWPTDLPKEELHFASTVTVPGQRQSVTATCAAGPLRLAAARADKIAGAVIVTDGQFQDDWTPAAADLGRCGRGVVIVPLDSPPADARISQITARRREPGGRVELHVTVTSNAAQDRLVTVADRRAGRALPPRALKMYEGDAASAGFLDADLAADLSAVYVAELSPPDAFPENDRMSAAVLPAGRTVAYVTAGGERPAGLEKALASAGVRVQSVPSAGAPADPAGWNDFAAIVLADPGPGGAPVLSPAQRQAVGEYVRRGGGLFQIGTGPHATPADREDPVNRVAALVANPYQRKPLKVIIVLDASASMSEPAAEGEAGMVRFDLAAQAVTGLERHLTAKDSLAVVTFSDFPRLIYNSGAGQIDFGRLHQALKDVRPGGKTVVLPALEEVAKVAPPEGQDGLVIVVSDLLTERFDPPKAAGLFAGKRLKLAVVVTNPPGGPEEGQGPLRKLAAILGAAIKPAGSLVGLAEIFAQFISDARGDALRRGEFSVAAAGGTMVLGVNVAALPGLKAYFLSAAQEGAEVYLRIGADPVMAARNAGLGSVVSLAVPLDQVGGEGAFDALLAAAVRHVLRRTDLPGFPGSASRRDGRCRIELTAYDPGRAGNWPRDGLKLTCDILRLDEDGAPAAGIPLHEESPGRYAAEAPAGDGPLGLLVRDSNGRTIWEESLAGEYPAEFSAIGPNRDNLRRLAQLTGGSIRESGDFGDLARQWQFRRFSPAWPYAIAAAIVLMLLDWATTRARRRA